MIVTFPLSGCCNYRHHIESVASGAKIEIFNDDLNEAIIGNGIYIGNGNFVTAAHVVNDLNEKSKVRILTNGDIAQASFTHVSKKYGIGYNDIAILQFPYQITALPNEEKPMPLCTGYFSNIDDYQIVGYHSLYPIPKNYIHFGTTSAYIDGSYEPGLSGSGIVDASRHCLVGIVSYATYAITKNYIEDTSVSTSTNLGKLFFTPANEIKNLLDTWKVRYLKQG